MDNKDIRVLEKLLQHTASIMNYCRGCKQLSDFEADPMRVEATVFNLMQIGELAKTSLSDGVKENITTIPWKQLYGMRNRIVHGYDGVNMLIVWQTVDEDIPQLHQELAKALESFGQ